MPTQKLTPKEIHKIQSELREAGLHDATNELLTQNLQSRGLTELVAHYVETFHLRDSEPLQETSSAIGYLLRRHQERVDSVVNETEQAALYVAPRHKN